MRLLTIAFVTIVSSFVVPAQEPQQSPTPPAQIQTQQGDYTLKVDVELVEIPISVLDRDGRPVNGLAREHFQVFEDRVQQQISLFKHEDVPISIGLVIDNSGSMRNKRERVNSAALSFIRESNPEDESFLVNFDDEAYLEQDFTGSIGNLIDALDNIDTRGETALYDAIFVSVDHVVDSGRLTKKALLVISDGEDNKSKYKYEEVVNRLKEAEVTVYAIGLLEENDQRGGLFRKSPSKKAKEVLTEFAEMTGGQAYFPKSIDEVDELCRRIAHDLRNHYTIGYNPTNAKLDGTWREISVKITPPRNFPKLADPRHKEGYFAPTPPVSANRPD